jgi:hypothetical protein
LNASVLGAILKQIENDKFSFWVKKRLQRKTVSTPAVQNLPMRRENRYNIDMDDTPNNPVPAEWAEALERSEAQLAAGQTVSGDSVRKRLRASIARMEAQLEPNPEISNPPVPHR